MNIFRYLCRFGFFTCELPALKLRVLHSFFRISTALRAVLVVDFRRSPGQIQTGKVGKFSSHICLHQRNIPHIGQATVRQARSQKKKTEPVDSVKTNL